MKSFLKLLSVIAITIFALVISPNSAHAQTDLELAEYYYNAGEFEQAKLYYESIYKSNRTNKVYERYLECLIALEDFEEAEKIVKKKLKSSRNAAGAHADLGALYKQFGETDKAEKEFNSAIKELQPGRSNATRLANSFIKISEFDRALQVYEKGKRIDPNNYGFHYELANLQGMMGNHEGMVESFMDLLIESPNYIQTVQNSLNRNLNIIENEEKAEMLRTTLLRRVQQYPKQSIYSELLIWYFNQKKDFASSLVQAKALDKRLQEDGHRMMDIAQMAVKNEDYTTAVDAYDYVSSKGPSNRYYVSAKTEALQARYTELVSGIESPTRDQMLELEGRFEDALTTLGQKESTAILMKDLAHIKAFHLQKSDEAIDLLNNAIDIPGIYKTIAAVCKLELGDILVLEGQIWDASLLFSQVELDFKEDPLGHEAKYRNARISYYTGDFEWAQAQLDVLKASTSKLISNDAIDLSLLITDNFNMDTLTTPMLMFAQAALLKYQNRDAEAMMKVDSIVNTWPGHTLTDEILWFKANITFEQGDYDKSQAYMEEILSLHFMDILADDALFKLAELFHFVRKDEAKAQELYQRILVEYPGSLYVVEARKRFRALRGDQLG
ncbi:MAG: tetratricopeptide repeat protein [Flavobacteriales bacterium]|nr:tetratricopeptide repeat protein [Flavobacteriales bacterium]